LKGTPFTKGFPAIKEMGIFPNPIVAAAGRQRCLDNAFRSSRLSA
jgi:hypothetical protein